MRGSADATCSPPSHSPQTGPSHHQDLTVTVAHPHYCTAALPATAQPAFVRRLAAQWKQLTTPAER